jgi:hypothetical protein
MDLPDEDTIRWIVTNFARIQSAVGEAVASPPLIQPDSTFFPDEFAVDLPSLRRLLSRMVGYAPVRTGVALDVVVSDGAGEPSESAGCGACDCDTNATPAGRSGRVDEQSDGYVVWIRAGDARRAESLTSAFARAIGSMVLREASIDPDDRISEIAAVACGFGVLLANGAAVWGKSCGGLRVIRSTALTVEELAVAVALFRALHGVRAGDVRRSFGATQRSAFDKAYEWVASNPMIVESLRNRPEVLEAGVMEIEPVRGMIGRWLHGRRLKRQLQFVQARPAEAPSEGKRRLMMEARELVDDVFGSRDG